MTSTTQDAEPVDLFDPASYEIGKSVGYLLGRAKNTLSQGVEQEVGSLDMTHAQASCLMMLAKHEATTATDLGGTGASWLERSWPRAIVAALAGSAAMHSRRVIWMGKG